MQIKIPAETLGTSIKGACVKVDNTIKHPGRLFVAAIAAGAFIAIGGILSLTVGFGFPGITASNPALCKLLAGIMFPIGLILVVVLGADLQVTAELADFHRTKNIATQCLGQGAYNKNTGGYFCKN